MISKNNILWAFALSALLPGFGYAGDWLSSWSIEVGMSSMYDDNILRYSDKYLTLFHERQDEGRFHVSTRDDLVLVSSFRGSATLQLVNTYPTTIAAEFRQRTFAGNGVKDWSSYDVSVRQGMGKQLSAGIGYNYAPYFYVRHYRDADWVSRDGYVPESFQPFDYAKDEFEGWIQRTLFKNTRVRAHASYARYFYNEHFTEYDCTNKSFGAEVGQSLSKSLRLDCRYDFVRSGAEGDANTDASYEEDVFGLRATWRLPDLLGRDNSLRIAGEYARRCFTTTHAPEVDPLHAGRFDHDHRVSMSYECRPLKKFSFALTSVWQWRDARTNAEQNAQYLSAERDFRQFQIGLEVKYIIRYVRTEDSEFEGNE